MRTIKLVLSYDGTRFCGWQIQPNGVAVQELLAKAIAAITGTRSIPVGSGRTDAGVHALAQVAHFHTESTLSPAAFLKALNAHLPEDIVIRSAEEAPGFDAQRDAVAKTYRYVFHDGPVRDPFLRGYSWKVKTRLDEKRMNAAAAHLVGTFDFRCFESHWPNRATSVRTISRCQLSRVGDVLTLDVTADGFLYNMVRAIAGSLYDVGRGRQEPAWLGEVVAHGKRGEAGPTAPAQGLFLLSVEY